MHCFLFKQFFLSILYEIVNFAFIRCNVNVNLKAVFDIEICMLQVQIRFKFKKIFFFSSFSNLNFKYLFFPNSKNDIKNY